MGGNHLIACVWYGLHENFRGNLETWGTMFLPESSETAYNYATSLHWSLTQLTPASMEVHPRNVHERFFNICVVILAMVAFTSLISSITNAMNHLRDLNS